MDYHRAKKHTQVKYKPYMAKIFSIVVRLWQKTNFKVCIKVWPSDGTIAHNMPTMLCSNHQSFIDPLLQKDFLGKILPHAQVIATCELDFPIVGSFLRNSNALWTEYRKDRISEAYLKGFEDGLHEAWEKGFPIGIYPEAQRSKDGFIRNFKVGSIAFLLNYCVSRQVDVQIIPSSIVYEINRDFSHPTSHAHLGLWTLIYRFLRPDFVGAYLSSSDPIVITPKEALKLLQNPKQIAERIRVATVSQMFLPVSAFIGSCLIDAPDQNSYSREQFELAYRTMAARLSKKVLESSVFWEILETFEKRGWISLRDTELHISTDEEFRRAILYQYNAAVSLLEESSLEYKKDA